MEYAKIKELLEKYWESATTPEEEDILRLYFNRDEVPAEWQHYKPLFQYYEQQREIRLGEDFDKKMLNNINSKKSPGKLYRLISIASLSAAAALILFFGIYFFNHTNNNHQATAYQQDTYKDPQRALAEVQRALLLVSNKMNEGEKLTTQKMQKLNTLNKVIVTNNSTDNNNE